MMGTPQKAPPKPAHPSFCRQRVARAPRSPVWSGGSPGASVWGLRCKRDQDPENWSAVAPVMGAQAPLREVPGQAAPAAPRRPDKRGSTELAIPHTRRQRSLTLVLGSCGMRFGVLSGIGAGLRRAHGCGVTHHRRFSCVHPPFLCSFTPLTNAPITSDSPNGARTCLGLQCPQDPPVLSHGGGFLQLRPHTTAISHPHKGLSDPQP